MSKLRLSITMSLDGYVAGSHQGKENPLGVGGMELHEWAFPLKEFREMHGEQGGETNASSSVVQERRANIGATIMGRNVRRRHRTLGRRCVASCGPREWRISGLLARARRALPSRWRRRLPPTAFA